VIATVIYASVHGGVAPIKPLELFRQWWLFYMFVPTADGLKLTDQFLATLGYALQVSINLRMERLVGVAEQAVILLFNLKQQLLVRCSQRKALAKGENAETGTLHRGCVKLCVKNS